MHESSAPSTVSFVSGLEVRDKSDLEFNLATFVVQHASHHRPIALVSSGGTAADLERNSVRCLDNFSTGLRGAVSVEEFLRRGYAVIHMQRQGSAAPFARVLSEALGLQQPNHGLDVDALGKLFAGMSGGAAEDEDVLVQQVLDLKADPWLTEPAQSHLGNRANGHHTMSPASNRSSELFLHRQLLYSSKLQTALRERSSALKEGRLLTVSFRTVEEYLTKLQLCAEALCDSRSLAIFYLAAAVSDYYIPDAEKSQHKIQSQEGINADGITLQLRPVPKTLGLLRTTWAPEAFVVSFKLETDITILRRKAEAAVQKYGCHLVIGNILQSRHSKVWVLAPPEELRYSQSTESVAAEADNNPSKEEDEVNHEWPFHEISKPQQKHSQESLETLIIDFVVQSHFEFISWHGYDEGSGLQSAIRNHEKLLEERRRLQREIFVKQLKGHVLTVAGTVLAVVISSAINTALHQRLYRR